MRAVRAAPAVAAHGQRLTLGHLGGHAHGQPPAAALGLIGNLSRQLRRAHFADALFAEDAHAVQRAAALQHQREAQIVVQRAHQPRRAAGIDLAHAAVAAPADLELFERARRVNLGDLRPAALVGRVGHAGHAQRRKDLVGQKRRIAHAGHDLTDAREQIHRRDGAVAAARARLKIERRLCALPHNALERVVLIRQRVDQLIPARIALPQSARMGQYVAHGDRSLRRFRAGHAPFSVLNRHAHPGKFGQIRLDRRVELDQSALLQDHHRHARDRLGHRGQAKQRVARHFAPRLEIGHALNVLIDCAAVHRHGAHRSSNVPRVDLLLQVRGDRGKVVLGPRLFLYGLCGRILLALFGAQAVGRVRTALHQLADHVARVQIAVVGHLALLGRSVGRKHPVGQIPALRRAARAHADARKIVAAEQIDDRAHPVVRAGAPLGTKADMPRLQIDVVVHHDQVIRLDLVPVHQLDHALAGQVHERLRLSQHDALAADAPLRQLRLALELVKGQPQPAGQQLHHVKPHVMAGAGVFVARIAQPHNDIHNAFPPLICFLFRRASRLPQTFPTRRAARQYYFPAAP